MASGSFNAGNDLYRPTAFTARLYVDVKDTLQALRPGH